MVQKGVILLTLLMLVGCATDRPVEDYGRISADAVFDSGQTFKGYGAGVSASYNFVVDQQRQIWIGPEYSFLYSRGEQEAENTVTGGTEWVERLDKQTHLLGGRIEFGNRTALRVGAVFQQQEIEREYQTFKLDSPTTHHDEWGYYVGLQNDLPLSDNVFLTPSITFYVLDGQANAAVGFGITIGF